MLKFFILKNELRVRYEYRVTTLKYYDWVASEMNDLRRRGIDGIKVTIFGTTLDSPD